MAVTNLAAILDAAAPDERPLIIELSPQGDERRRLTFGEGRRRIAALALAWEAQFLAPLAPAERRTLERVLTKLTLRAEDMRAGTAWRSSTG